MVRRSPPLQTSRRARPRAATQRVDGARHRNRIILRSLRYTDIRRTRVQRLQWTSGVNVREGGTSTTVPEVCTLRQCLAETPPRAGTHPRESCVGAAWEMPSPRCPDGMVLYTTLVPCFSTHRVLGRACAWRAQTASMWPGAARKTHTLPEVAVSRRRMQARRRVVTISARSSTMKALRLK